MIDTDALRQVIAQQDELIQQLITIYETAVDNWSAQCFCYTSAPESMRRQCHEVARDGFRALADALSPLVMPTLKAEFAEASRLAREADPEPLGSPTP